jgi:hypothetical protein
LFPEAAPPMISSGECLRFLREPPRSTKINQYQLFTTKILILLTTAV